MAKEIHEHPQNLIKPGNEEYLSYYIKQEKWKPTESIGGGGTFTNSSPGPAIVLLPPTIGNENHDPRKTKGPAYVIGAKDPRQTFSCGPGPASYDVRKITNKGTDVCHAPLVGEKIEGLVPFRSPGPASCNRGVCDPYVYPKNPAYTMRPKINPLKSIVTPAPSAYTLPETLGPGQPPYRKSPCYTMASKLDKNGIRQQNPGPAAYLLPPTDVNKIRSPAYSMRTKDKTGRIGTITPGPASNYYHMVKFHKPSTPRYTFGIRHTPFEAFQRFAAEN